ncbi:MAG: PEP-CTERM sorting domain-containing protein [Akkermansia sp.]
MRKTLIALLALGSTALGVDTLKGLDDSVLTLGTVTIGGASEISASNGFLAFQVGTGTEAKTTLTHYILTFGYDAIPSSQQDSWLRLSNNGDFYGPGIATTSGTTMCLKSNTGTSDVIQDTALNINTTDTFALTVWGTTVMLSNLTTGSCVSTSVANATTWKILSGKARVFTNSGNNQIQFGQIADLSGLTAAQAAEVAKSGTFTAVPEPATATLSLMALAGLAARRRRK